MEILKTIALGFIEGITEWLPISSTGHLILAQEFIKFKYSAAFWDMFLVVIQFGAILAVILLYFGKLLPISFDNGIKIKKEIVLLWLKIILSCLPAAFIGLLWDEQLNALFYNSKTVSIMLISVGIIFILIENHLKDKKFEISDAVEISFRAAFIIGLFQVIAAVFPGTSRSGATIIGALLLGVSRKAAAEYSFFLAIPVMAGASALKLFEFGFAFTLNEFITLIIGMLTAFIVSIFAVNFLLSFISKHSFKFFGWYRIILGFIVLFFSFSV
ncbi:MAG: undecaprenyl-diphosphate phosphatase [Elusimicrobiota bacterium]|jgi:undecaprenyl-diphosphatase|nr:undecaprenyl-diphosphate phosphatase [Elusimicrobiota bacterium]